MATFNPALAAAALAQNLTSNARHSGNPSTVYTRPNRSTQPKRRGSEVVRGHDDHVADAGDMVEATGLRCDPEIGRIAYALRQSILLRPWMILRQLARETGQAGFTLSEIAAALVRFNVKHTQPTLKRWLWRGVGRYWNYDAHTARYYHVSPVRLAAMLIETARRVGLHDLYITNYPGQRQDFYIDVSGSTRDFDQRIYETWMASRNSPSISRYVLTRLFNRDESNLRALERGSRLRVVSNFAFCDPAFSEYTPFDENGERRRDVQAVRVNGRWVMRWQISNSYQAPPVRQHNKRGVSRRVLYTVLRHTPGIQATGTRDATGESLGSLNRTPRMFHDSHERAKNHADKHGERIRYALLGVSSHSPQAYYEVTPDGGKRLEYLGCARTMQRVGAGKTSLRDVTREVERSYEGI